MNNRDKNVPGVCSYLTGHTTGLHVLLRRWLSFFCICFTFLLVQIARKRDYKKSETAFVHVCPCFMIVTRREQSAGKFAGQTSSGCGSCGYCDHHEAGTHVHIRDGIRARVFLLHDGHPPGGGGPSAGKFAGQTSSGCGSCGCCDHQKQAGWFWCQLWRETRSLCMQPRPIPLPILIFSCH
jgi:hypothetical protein